MGAGTPIDLRENSCSSTGKRADAGRTLVFPPGTPNYLTRGSTSGTFKDICREDRIGFDRVELRLLREVSVFEQCNSVSHEHAADWAVVIIARDHFNALLRPTNPVNA